MNSYLYALIAISSILSFALPSNNRIFNALSFAGRAVGVGAGVTFLYGKTGNRKKNSESASSEQQAIAHLQQQQHDREAQLKAQLATLQQQLDQSLNPANELFDRKRQELQRFRDDLIKHEQAQQQALSERVKQREIELQQRAEAMAAAMEKAIAANQQQIAAIQEHAQKEIENWQQIAWQKAAEVETARAPRRAPRSAARVMWVAEQVQQLFDDFEVPVEYVNAASINGTDYLEFRALKTVKQADVKKALEEVPTNVEGIDGAATFTIEGGLISVEIKSMPEKIAKQTREKQPLTLEGYDYFKLAVGGSNHDLVMGPTGGGKSTLIANLIDAASGDLSAAIAEYRQNWNVEVLPGINVQLIDPKFSNAKKAGWRINGRLVRPQYQGFERLQLPDGREIPSAIDGCKAMGIAIRQRLTDGRIADYADQVLPLQPLIFMTDEAEQLVADYKKEAAGPILFTSRVGRSELVRGIIAGQNTNPSAYGLQVPHINNYTRWYLGSAIARIIYQSAKDGGLFTTAAQRNKYAQEYERLKQVALTDPTKRYFALVKFPDHVMAQPVFVHMPPPSYFADGQLDDNVLDLQPLPFSVDESGQPVDLPEIEYSEDVLGDDIYSSINQSMGLTIADVLERSLQASPDRGLSDDDRKILEYARKQGDFINWNQLRTNVYRFKSAEKWPIESIKTRFQALANQGFGTINDDGHFKAL